MGHRRRPGRHRNRRGHRPSCPTTIDDEDDEVPGRRWLRLAAVVGASLVLLLAVVVAFNLGRGRTPLGPCPTTTPAPTRPRPDERPAPITGVTARDFDPQGDPPEENPDLAPLAVDGDPATAWRTRPTTRTSGPAGSRPAPACSSTSAACGDVAAVDLTLVGAPTERHLFVTTGGAHRRRGLDRGAPPRPSTATARGSRSTEPATGRFVTVWLTSLPTGRRRLPGRGRRGRGPRMTATDDPGPDRPSDADLLAAHVHGDADAFGVLFARHRDRLWAVALRTMGNPEDAADGLQDGLIAAYRRAGSFRGEAAVTTWLHRVVVNACLDRLRAAKVRRAEALPDDLDEYGEGPGSLPTGHARPRPRRPGAGRRSGAATCSPPWPRCPPSSGPRWCSSTWRATPSPRPPRCSTAPSGP